MASVSTVVTMGYGSFGSVNLLPTLGYGIGEAVVTEDRPVCGTLAVSPLVNGTLAAAPLVNGTLAIEDC